MQQELRDPAELQAWLGSVRGDTVWFMTVLAECGGLPPPACVVDLCRIVMNHPGLAVQVSQDTKKLRQSWEDQVLGRILGSGAQLQALQDALAKLPTAMQSEAAGMFASLVLNRLTAASKGQGIVSVVPGVVRRVLNQSAVPDTDILVTPTSDELTTWGYAGLVMGARLVPDLLGAGDVFLMTWLEKLRPLEARTLMNQVAEVSKQTTADLPRRIPKNTRRKRGTARTQIEEDSAYPIGGFSSISNAGAIENMVTSELAYMEDEGSKDMDMFDLRWAEGELLYYSRDEGAFHRERRMMQILVDPMLATVSGTARSLVLGKLVSILNRTVELLGEYELRIQVLFPVPKHTDKSATVLMRIEMEVFELLVQDLVQRGVLTVSRDMPLEAGTKQAAGVDFLYVGRQAGTLSLVADTDALTVLRELL